LDKNSFESKDEDIGYLARQHFVDALKATNIEGAWNNKPTIVLSADNEIARLTGALELHKGLASLSTIGEQIVVPHHFLLAFPMLIFLLPQYH
jgi:hypothetical protein